MKPQHYLRFKGEVARIQTLAPVAGRRRFQGVLVDATETEVSLQIDNEVVTLPFADIEKAKLVPTFENNKPLKTKADT